MGSLFGVPCRKDAEENSIRWAAQQDGNRYTMFAIEIILARCLIDGTLPSTPRSHCKVGGARGPRSRLRSCCFLYHLVERCCAYSGIVLIIMMLRLIVCAVIILLLALPVAGSNDILCEFPRSAQRVLRCFTLGPLPRVFFSLDMLPCPNLDCAAVIVQFRSAATMGKVFRPAWRCTMRSKQGW